MDITFDINTPKNLLAFSGGVDSTALFFLLLEHNISFDIAIVDYNQRAQSKDEVIYATQLAHKYKKRCFISTYEDEKFSEKSARDFRYKFFDEIIKKDGYHSLITAHQLNDKLEWFLMQFTKGAGVVELMGLDKVSFKNGYQIHKPLLDISKSSLKEYLEINSIKYFVDDTNFDERYKRNYFRKHFANDLLENFEDGIKNSFKYLQKDIDTLYKDIKKEEFKELSVYRYSGDKNIAIRVIDKELKKRGIIITKQTRDEIVSKKELVVSHKVAVTIKENKIYIAPYLNTTMDKKFKERSRVAKIPKNIRAYLYTVLPNLDILPECLQD